MFNAAVQNRFTAGCFSAITPVEMCSSYRCAVTQHQCTAILFLAKCNPPCSVLLCKTGSQQACVSATTPMEICFPYRCAVSQQKCTATLFQHTCSATLFRAKCNPHCSVLLCKRGSQQAVCQCNYTYGDVHFIQVCSDPAPVHCNTVSGKMQSPLFSAALQKRLTAGSVSLQ